MGVALAALGFFLLFKHTVASRTIQFLRFIKIQTVFFSLVDFKTQSPRGFKEPLMDLRFSFRS